MFAVAAPRGPSDDVATAPALRLIGAAPLAALMAAARVELGRERASSCGADAPNSAHACGSASQAREERR